MIKVALEHIRALILRESLGVMSIAPVATKRVLLGIEPFHLTTTASGCIPLWLEIREDGGLVLGARGFQK